MKKKAYVISSNNTISKLQDSHHEQKRHKHISQLHALRSLFHITVPDSEHHVLGILRVAQRGTTAVAVAALCAGLLGGGCRGAG